MKVALLARAFPIIAGIISVAAAVVLGLKGNGDASTFAVVAAAAWFVQALHRCPDPAPAPDPEPVERGSVTINFDGGPNDGGWTVLPSADLPEMLGREIYAEDATYTVTAVDHTCYTAEVSR